MKCGLLRLSSTHLNEIRDSRSPLSSTKPSGINKKVLKLSARNGQVASARAVRQLSNRVTRRSNSIGLQAVDGAIMFGQLTTDDYWALGLSTLAGLSTSIGGVLAVIKRPDEALLAFLLGIAIGVMASLSIVEMYIHNAMENGFVYVSIAAFLGALAFYLINPFFPEFDVSNFNDELKTSDDGRKKSEDPEINSPTISQLEQRERGGVPLAKKTASMQQAMKRQVSVDPVSAGSASSLEATVDPESGRPPVSNIPPAELMRLGLLMAVTMTIHNCPEGFAVAFAANTQIGLMLATAIAIHNIPEGIIVAAPVFAATGNRWMAVGIATVSGLSEPLGALAALLFIRPFLNEAFLNYTIAFVGGVMFAVCVCELWPEARKCQSDWKLAQGCIAGAGIMLWTLHMGV